MSPEEQMAMMMQMMNPEVVATSEKLSAMPEGPIAGNFDDPEGLWEGIRQRFRLSPEELNELRIENPAEGLSLGQRLQRLRPSLNVGPMELTVDGSVNEPRIEGRMRF